MICALISNRPQNKTRNSRSQLCVDVNVWASVEKNGRSRRQQSMTATDKWVMEPKRRQHLLLWLVLLSIHWCVTDGPNECFCSSNLATLHHLSPTKAIAARTHYWQSKDRRNEMPTRPTVEEMTADARHFTHPWAHIRTPFYLSHRWIRSIGTFERGRSCASAVARVSCSSAHPSTMAFPVFFTSPRSNRLRNMNISVLIYHLFAKEKQKNSTHTTWPYDTQKGKNKHKFEWIFDGARHRFICVNFSQS